MSKNFYESPAIEVLEVEIENAVLSASVNVNVYGLVYLPFVFLI